MNGSHWADQLSQDLRFALRSLRRSPGMTMVMVIVLTLSISVAAVTTFFGFVNTIIRPLPYFRRAAVGASGSRPDSTAVRDGQIRELRRHRRRGTSTRALRAAKLDPAVALRIE